jgi:hypothetical protein
MKRRRIYYKNWLGKVSKQDKALQSELGEIKQHLVNTESIKEHNKVHADQIYKAWTKATGNRDRQRTFTNRLHEYIDGGYFTPIDKKYKILRAEEKFLAL